MHILRIQVTEKGEYYICLCQKKEHGLSIKTSLLLCILQNEKEESVVVSVYLRQYWKDAKMVWEPSDFGNITSTKLPPSNIWLPDVVLYNK